MGYDTSPLWLQTLAEQSKDDAAEARATLRSAYIQFRAQVAPVAQEIALSAPAYTDHSILHCDSLWDTASKLIDKTLELNPAEAFVLGGAFLVHDLGMGLSAYPGGLAGILADVRWLDLLSSLYDDADQLHQEALNDVAEDPNWDGLSNSRTKGALVMYMRLQHAKQAEHILQEEWTLTNGDHFHLLADTALRHWYGNAIGKIARSHWIDVAQLPDYLPPTLGAVPGYPASWKVDPIKVACALRLADAVHIDGRRADPLHTPHRNPQGDSGDHWHFQEKFLALQVEQGRAIFSSSAPFDTDQIDAWWLAYDTVRQADSELRRVDSLCADLGLPRFLANAAAGAESPKRFAKFVETLNWEPVDARPYIGDQNLVMQRLGGWALYGTGREESVPLREALANALDATRALRIAYPENTPDPIQVTFASDDGGDILVVRDFGIGMTVSDVRDKLCNFGTSGWRDSSTQAAFPGLVGAGFKPTGQFGIGFFSVFMVAQRVQVVTRHVAAGIEETLVLEFSDGLDGRPVLRSANRAEQMLKPGTELRLHLDNEFGSENGIFPSFYREELTDPAIVSSLIAQLALMSDENIEVKALQESTFSLAVTRDHWRQCDAVELFDLINSPTVRKYPQYEPSRDRFGKMLQPVFSPSGELVGRLGLNTVSSFDYVDHLIHSAQGYCGGLAASLHTYGLVGVAAGEPTAATRREINIDIDIDEIQRWFKEQMAILDHEEIEPRAALRVQEFAVSIGLVADTQPLAFSSRGYLLPAAVRALLIESESLLIVEGSPLQLEIEGQTRNLFDLSYSDDFGIVDESFLVITDSSGVFEQGLPRRQNDLEKGFSVAAQKRAKLNLDSWWRTTHRSALGELVRMAAEVWKSSIEEVLASIEPLDLWRNGADTRLDVKSLGGTAKVEAYRLHVPKKPKPRAARSTSTDR